MIKLKGGESVRARARDRDRDMEGGREGGIGKLEETQERIMLGQGQLNKFI